MAEYRDRYADFTAAGTQVVALSVDSEEEAAWLIRDLQLPFPNLRDSDKSVTKAWGLFNAEEKGGIPHPATFIIDAGRRVRFRSLERTSARVNPAPILAVLRGEPRAEAKARKRFLWPDWGVLYRGWKLVKPRLHPPKSR